MIHKFFRQVHPRIKVNNAFSGTKYCSVQSQLNIKEEKPIVRYNRLIQLRIYLHLEMYTSLLEQILVQYLTLSSPTYLQRNNPSNIQTVNQLYKNNGNNTFSLYSNFQ